MIKHFFKTNKINFNTSEDIVTIKEQSLFQQWFSLCYSLQLFSDYAQMRILDTQKQKFTDSTDVIKILNTLLAPVKTSTKVTKRKSPLKGKKKKEQPRKKFKKQ